MFVRFHAAITGRFPRIALLGKSALLPGQTRVCEGLDATTLSAKNGVDLSQGVLQSQRVFSAIATKTPKHEEEVKIYVLVTLWQKNRALSEPPSKLHADLTQPVALDLVEPGANGSITMWGGDSARCSTAPRTK